MTTPTHADLVLKLTALGFRQTGGGGAWERGEQGPYRSVVLPPHRAEHAIIFCESPWPYEERVSTTAASRWLDAPDDMTRAARIVAARWAFEEWRRVGRSALDDLAKDTVRNGPWARPWPHGVGHAIEWLRGKRRGPIDAEFAEVLTEAVAKEWDRLRGGQ